MIRGKLSESSGGRRRTRACAREKSVQFHRSWAGKPWYVSCVARKLPKDIQWQADTGSTNLKLIEV